MKKSLSVLSKTASAAQVLGIGLLLLISCNNIFVSPREDIVAGNGETGTALISFGNGVEGARTLLPSAVNFERYDLAINPVAPNSEAPENHIITDGSTDLIELAIGDWTIHVDAYTDAEGSHKAAEGDSAVFTVHANETTPVSIVLAAVGSAGDGVLSVDIAGGSGVVITNGSLYIYNGPDFDNYVDDVYFGSTGLDRDISLPAGQYRVQVEIYNNEDQRAYINEVAYIYSNLTTPFDRVFTAGDFSPVTTIVGTVQYTENGVYPGNSYALAVFTNPEGDGSYLDWETIYSAGAQTYTLHIPRPDKNITFYFHIYKNGRWFFADSLTLTPGEILAVKNISLDINTITLSGTVSVTVGGAPLTSVSVSASPEGGGASFDGSVSGSTWTISGIPLDFSGTLNLSVWIWHDEQYYSVWDAGSWTSGSGETNIPLTVALVRVSGSFTVTENLIPVSEASVYIYAYKESVAGSGDFYEYLEGNLYHTWTGNTCNWSIITRALSPPTQVRGQIHIDSLNDSVTETITLGAADVTIPPRAYTFTSTLLSGTIGTVTVNGIPSYFNITGISSPYYNYYYNSGDDTNWQIRLPEDFSGTLTIRVEVYYDGQSFSKDVCDWNSGSSTTGIDLEDVSFNLITLIGTIGTATFNGIALSDITVYARNSGNYYYSSGHAGENSYWQIHIPSDFAGTLDIGVNVEYGGVGYSKSVTTWTSGSSVIDINLGDVEFSYTILSGTIGMVTVNGVPPSDIIVYARTPDGSTYFSGSGAWDAWTISQIPGDFTGTLDIGVEVQYHGSRFSEVLTTWTSGSSVTGIELGNVNLSSITLDGTIGAVTVNGNTLSSVSISAYPEGGGSGLSGTISGGNWQIYLSGDFTGILNIYVGFEYNGQWYSRDIATASISGSSVGGIDLGNIAFVTLSGTLDTVMVNGSTPEVVGIYARIPGDSYWTRVDGNSWTVVISAGFAGNLDIEVEIEYEGQWYSKNVTTTAVSGLPVTGINLGSVTFIFNPIGGTVTTDGITPLDTGQLYVFSPDYNILDLYYQMPSPLGAADIANGSFSGYVDDGFASGYVVIEVVDDDFYITMSPVSLGTSMSLDLSTMVRASDFL